ncbi:MAG: hypothetical protein JWR37_3205, partial [Mycobacterium sp.]|nr:hypothetical protein [Mycobacterium sp.]
RVIVREVPVPQSPPPVQSLSSPPGRPDTLSGGAEVEEDAAYFYDQLTPYGEWIEVQEFGPCWRPHDYLPDWRPYTLGHWAYTDECGWFWITDEPFGWCCYHYGRWAFVERVGWCWVPGRTWGPAWVVWRQGGGYIGWAALPPGRGGVDVSIEIGVNVAEPPHWAFAFVEERYITDEHLRDHIEPATRNVTIFNVTKNITRYEVVNGRFVNRGIDVNYVQKVTGKSVRHYRLNEVARPNAAGVHGDRIGAYRPSLPARRTPARVSPRFVSEEPRPRSVAQLESYRRAVEARYQELAAQMAERHQRELFQPPPGLAREQLLARQQREVRSFEEMRNRELQTMQMRGRARTLRRWP